MAIGGLRVAAVLVAFGIVSAACSGDDDATSDTTVDTGGPSTSATPRSSPPETATTEAADTQPPTTDAPFRYEATIQRTSYNIPHITAADFGSLGYGYGYAFAEDHLCSLADVVVQARSEAASFFGAGTDDMWLNQDLVYEALDLYGRASADLDAADPEPRAVIEGYAAGYNRYLADTGADAVNGYCAGEPWVRPIDEYDLAAYFKSLSWRASVDPLLGYIASATPPVSPDTTGTAPATSSEASSVDAAGTAGATEYATAAWPGSSPTRPRSPATRGRSVPIAPRTARRCSSATRTSRGRVRCGSTRRS